MGPAKLGEIRTKLRGTVAIIPVKASKPKSKARSASVEKTLRLFRDALAQDAKKTTTTREPAPKTARPKR